MIGRAHAVSSRLLYSTIPFEGGSPLITVFPMLTAYVGIDGAKTKLDVVLRLVSAPSPRSLPRRLMALLPGMPG